MIGVLTCSGVDYYAGEYETPEGVEPYDYHLQGFPLNFTSNNDRASCSAINIFATRGDYVTLFIRASCL